MARDRAAPGLLTRAFDAARAAAGAFSTRSADGFATGQYGRDPRRMQPAYNAASDGPNVPMVPDLGPFDSVRFMRPCQRLVRSQYRNDNLIKSLADRTGELMIPGPPVPVSKFPELDDLWCVASEGFDARGNQPLAAWLRNDIVRDMTLDGEALVRRRGRNVRRMRDGSLVPERGLMVPMQWQSLPSAYLPIGDTSTERVEADNVLISGIEFDPIESRVAYHPYTRHPLTRTGGILQQNTRILADEMHHCFIPSQTGSPRPEVPLAAGVLVGLKNAQFLDANARQMLLSACFTVMIEEQKVEGDDDELDEDEVREALETITMSPGGINRLPKGLAAKTLSPQANPNFAVQVRTNILYMCAGLGTPVFEVTGDYDAITERAMKFAGLSIRRRGDIFHDLLEFQLLNRMRRAFIDGVYATGLWTPPPGRPLWEAYACEWQWPTLQITQMTQEIAAAKTAVEMGAIDIDSVTTSTYGVRPEVRDRRAAKSAARSTALGLTVAQQRWGATTPVAERIAAEALAEETAERDVVEQASREDSVIDADAS